MWVKHKIEKKTARKETKDLKVWFDNGLHYACLNVPVPYIKHRTMKLS